MPDDLKNKLGIAVGQHAYRAYRDLIASDRWQRLENAGARPQRLLFASTRPRTSALRHAVRRRARGAQYGQHHARGDAARLRRSRHARRRAAGDGGDCDAGARAHEEAGVDVDALAQQLQSDGAKAFVASWQDLLGSISSKSKALA